MRHFLLLLVLLLAIPAIAQVQVAPFLTPRIQVFDNSGKPLSGGCVFFFAAGTSTPQNTYTDSSGNTPASNPVVLDSAGRAEVWLSSLAYKVQVKTAGGVNCASGSQLYVSDNVTWATQLSTFAGLNIAGNFNVTQPTAATGGANQSSFTDCISGNYWTGAASAADKWCWQDVLGTGTNPTSTDTLTHSGSSGVNALDLTAATTTKMQAATITGALTAGTATATSNVNAGSPTAASSFTTINTKSGIGQTQAVNYFANASAAAGTGYNVLNYQEQYCGTNEDTSSFVGNNKIAVIGAMIADDTCTQTSVEGMVSVVRSEKTGAAGFSPLYAMRSFEADVSDNAIDATFLGGASGTGDLNITGGLFNSTGNNHGGTGLWVHGTSAANSWQRGIVVDGYNNYGIHVVSDNDNQVVLETVTGSSKNATILFRDAGVNKWTLAKNTANGFVIFDGVNSLARLSLVASAASELDAIGSNQVRLNYQGGTSGTCFGSGSSTCVASMNGSGVMATYNNIGTAGQGVTWIPGATSQKAETGAADANVLTVTPAAVAGMYRACFVASVSSATSGVISWTLSWTDSNGTVQSNIVQDLFQDGSSAPAGSFTTSAAGNYYACRPFDVNNAAANIVVKWVGGGTTAAKVSASVERII